MTRGRGEEEEGRGEDKGVGGQGGGGQWEGEPREWSREAEERKSKFGGVAISRKFLKFKLETLIEQCLTGKENNMYHNSNWFDSARA